MIHYSQLTNKIYQLQEKYNSQINTYANHLIVIFAFFVPLSTSGRRATFFLIFSLFLLRGNYIYYLKEGLKDKIVQAFCIYFAMHVIWLIGTDDFDHAKKVMHEAKFLLYPLLFITLIDKQYLPRTFGAFFLGVFISVIWSYGIFLEILPPNIHDGNQGIPSNPTPVFHHSHYGYMLAIATVLAIQNVFLNRNNDFTKLYYLLFFVLVSINLFITEGRAGYLLYVILLFTLLLVAHKTVSLKTFLVTASLCLLILIVSLNTSSTFKNRITQTIYSLKMMFDEKNYHTAIGARVGIAIYSKDLFIENWVTGVGTGDQLAEFRKFVRERYSHFHNAYAIQHLHNEYINAAIQFGIIGVLAYLYLLLQFFVYKQNNPFYKTSQILLGVSIFFFSFVEIFVHGLAALLVLITLISLTFSSYVTFNANLDAMNARIFSYYCISIIGIELISWFT